MLTYIVLLLLGIIFDLARQLVLDKRPGNMARLWTLIGMVALCCALGRYIHLYMTRVFLVFMKRLAIQI